MKSNDEAASLSSAHLASPPLQQGRFYRAGSYDEAAGVIIQVTFRYIEFMSSLLSLLP